MTAYTSTIRNDNPKGFWTFDTDRQGISTSVVDESGNGSHMNIRNDDPFVPNHEGVQLEKYSLVELEPGDKYSVTMGESQAVNGEFPHNYLETPHTNVFDLSANHGSFSFEFFYYKASPDDILIGDPTKTIETPILFKDGLINIVTVRTIAKTYLQVDYSYVALSVIIYDDDPLFDTFNKTNHVVVVQDVIQVNTLRWVATLKVYINGRLMGSDSREYLNTPPSTTFSGGALQNGGLLFGSNGRSNKFLDYATELLRLDSVAMFDYALNEEQITNHYRKTVPYYKVVKNSSATFFLEFNDLPSITNNKIEASIAYSRSLHYGNVTRYNIGVDRIPNTRSMLLTGNGRIDVIKTGVHGNTTTLLDISDDYTVDFWFNTSQEKYGVLFEFTEHSSEDSAGIRIMSENGRIFVKESIDTTIYSLQYKQNGDVYDFGDGYWHHVALIREGTRLTLYLDAVSHGYIDSIPNGMDYTGMGHLMNDRNSSSPVLGSVSLFAIYKHALKSYELLARYNYAFRYKVQGHTLLQGSPIAATVRVYNSITGELMGQTISSGVDGEYTYYPLTNDRVDIVYILGEYSNVRHRVHGSVLPAEIQDVN